ncbi:unnamed protein product [Chondrus crispus]|uniref:Integrase catalytic domain-containing protein n=1 Tax=Chondrus crispus TaxID=2769 RepID=R7QLY9_CHOCR|nr:unnamed protein product [Chondrus crispus]CDF38803.1 unnamed protein product [Chondrus crispus]|eukprot:XP_005718708.1 unnamed protein product [Chondrus crispus]
MSQTTLRKVLGWAVRLSAYNYTCVHIRGTDNVWADLLGRWAPPPTIRRLVRIPALPSASADDFEWPSSRDIAKAQNETALPRPKNLQKSNGLWLTSTGAIWIPDDSTDLQLRLCVIAHTNAAGHRGSRTTEHVMCKAYHWSTQSADIGEFVKACIHCLSTTGGGKMPRRFGPAFHGTHRNDLLQFDYIDLGTGSDGANYVLMMRDDFSDYKWFFPFADTSAANAATAIIDWCAALGVPKSLMSDGPTHLRNETIRLVAKGLKVPHHFTLPYCPWSNGAVERLGKELVRTCRATLSELQMRPEEWPDILPIIQSTLNNTPSRHRGNVAPITAFLGADPTPPIHTFLRSSTVTSMTVSEVQADHILNVDKLKSLIADLHLIVSESLKKNRQKAREAASRGELPKFEVGDFVLVA